MPKSLESQGKVGRLSEGVFRRLIARMNRVADDDRLGPNRRLLAALISSYWSARIAQDKEEQAFIASIILGEFVNRNGFKLYGPDNKLIEKEGEYTKLEVAAGEHIKAAFEYAKKDLQVEGFIPDDDTENTSEF